MLERLNIYLRAKKLRHSDSRKKILETIVSEVKHFTALELVSLIKKRHPDIGYSSSYRTLTLLVECEVLKKGLTDQSGEIYYELNEVRPHDHIMCLDCKKIFEFQDNGLEKIQEAISETTNFTSRSHAYVIYASCNYLKKK